MKTSVFYDSSVAAFRATAYLIKQALGGDSTSLIGSFPLAGFPTVKEGHVILIRPPYTYGAIKEWAEILQASDATLIIYDPPFALNRAIKDSRSAVPYNISLRRSLSKSTLEMAWAMYYHNQPIPSWVHILSVWMQKRKEELPWDDLVMPTVVGMFNDVFMKSEEVDIQKLNEGGLEYIYQLHSLGENIISNMGEKAKQLL